jgi:Zn-dependent protease
VNLFEAFVVGALALGVALLVAIPVHEMGHALAAYLLGDRSVRYFGYFTLDPRRFLEPFGVIAVFVALVGWGRRVPIQPNRIGTTGKKVLYELGGPAANLVVGLVVGFIWRLLDSRGFGGLDFPASPAVLGLFVYAIFFLNLSIFAFQLLPIPGLDGWNIIEALFRDRNPRFFYNASVRRREVWAGCVILLVAFQIFQGPNLLAVVMTPAYQPASLISTGICHGYAIPALFGLRPCLL